MAAVLALLLGQPSLAARAEEAGLATPAIYEEIVDIAVAHCRQGQREQAKALFQAIQQQLDPPPAVRQLIEALERGGCAQQPPSANAAAATLQLGAGFDSNASQGIRSQSLVIGSGADAIELPLDERYRPRSSSFVQLAGDVGWPVAPDWTVRVAGLARRNAATPQFDVAAYNLTAVRALRSTGHDATLQVSAGELWLGSERYQRSLAAQAQGVLAGSAHHAWVGRASFTSVWYPTQSIQNAWQAELGLGHEWRLSPTLAAFGEMAWQHDHAQQSRPGGSRHGVQALAGLAWRSAAWQIRPQLQYTHWLSTEVFAPGLIDVRRHNRTWQLDIQAERPLSAQQALVLEWRSRHVADAVALYQYSAHSVAVSIRHRF